MKTLTRDNEALVVFWTLHERKDYAARRFAKTKKATEFPASTPPDKAEEQIYLIHGRITDRAPGGSMTKQYATIAGTKLIRPHERGQIDSWTASQEGLFAPQEWQQCVSFKKQDKPF